MSADHPIARGLASAFLSGEWTREGMSQRAALVLGTDRGSAARATAKLASRVLQTFGEQPPLPALRQLTRFIESSRLFWRWIESDEHGLPRELNLSQLPQPVMTPAPAIPSQWGLPAIVTPGKLADWLGLSPRKLDWLADCHGWEARRPREALRHYRYRWIAKRSGGCRLLEMPKRRLKEAQRTILRDILNRVVPHEAAHAFRAERSIASFAAPHAGQGVVLRIDLRDFFPSVPAARVFALFRTLGYPEAVARLLCGLCTNTAPDDVLREGSGDLPDETQRRLSWQFAKPHLPQGAPTSPALANLAARRLDSRLSALAAKFGAAYTRYADDLVFSGGRAFERCLPRFRVWQLAIVLDEGFTIRRRKTRIMPAHRRQQLAGLIVNEHPNVPRHEFDQLRAILFNCARHGPATQLRAVADEPTANEPDVDALRNHLAGKIAYVRMINPQKAERLLRLFAEVDWAG